MLNKNSIILLSAICFTILLSGKTKKTLVINGSESMIKVTQLIAKECYHNTEFDVQINEVESNAAIQSLLDKKCDIAMSSRRMRSDEKLRAKLSKIVIVETIAALDGIVFIVNHNNPITQLSRSNIIDIYSGKANNWKDFGGNNNKIHITIKDNDGSYTLFKENIMEEKTVTVSVFKMPGSEGIVQTIAQLTNSIGFIQFSYLDSTVKALNYAADNTTYIQPSKASIKNKSYPLTQPIYYYYLAENAEKAKPFIDAVVSSRAQEIFDKNGFVTLTRK